jgi:hypothetical protein
MNPQENSFLPDIDIRKNSIFDNEPPYKERNAITLANIKKINLGVDYLPEIDLNNTNPVYINGQYSEHHKSFSIHNGNEFAGQLSADTSLPDVDIHKGSILENHSPKESGSMRNSKIGSLPNIDIYQNLNYRDITNVSETLDEEGNIDDEKSALKFLWRIIDKSDLPNIDIMKQSANQTEEPKTGLLKFQRKSSKAENSKSSNMLKALRERLSAKPSSKSYSMNDLNKSGDEIVAEVSQVDFMNGNKENENENFTFKAKEALTNYKKSKK